MPKTKTDAKQLPETASRPVSINLKGDWRLLKREGAKSGDSNELLARLGIKPSQPVEK
jgi:hypothetical protein